MSKLVLWSGGCDSTLCLLNALKENRRQHQEAISADKHIKPVRALSISHMQCYGRSQERAARAKIKTALESRGFKFEHTDVTIRSSGSFQAQQNGTVQPLIWLGIALSYAKEDDDVVLGYVREDDIWHYRDRFIWAFNYLKQLNKCKGFLETPLEWRPKWRVLTALKDTGLLKLCWWCENPTKKGKPCYRCHCCQDHRKARQRVQKGR